MPKLSLLPLPITLHSDSSESLTYLSEGPKMYCLAPEINEASDHSLLSLLRTP